MTRRTYDGAAYYAHVRLTLTTDRERLVVLTGDPSQGRLGVSVATASAGEDIWASPPTSIGHLERHGSRWLGYRCTRRTGWGTRSHDMVVDQAEERPLAAAMRLLEAWELHGPTHPLDEALA